MGGPASDAARLAQLRTMVAGRTQGDEPKKGYRRNVQALRGEIARLEALVAGGPHG